MSTMTLGKNWWLIALRGVLAILFGLGAFFWPGLTLVVLVTLFGAYALVDGIFTMGLGFSQRGAPDWWVLVLQGLAGVGAGVLTFLWPDITTLALLYLIAGWAIITGVLEIITAIRLRAVIENEWLLVLGGVLSVLLGVFMVLWPETSALAVVWAIGAYAITFGVVLIALGFKARTWQTPTTPTDQGAMRPA